MLAVRAFSPPSGSSAAASPQSFQPSPNSSIGCCVRSEPLPQRMASGEQYWSQPQQMRSGFLGLRGKGLAMGEAIVVG